MMKTIHYNNDITSPQTKEEVGAKLVSALLSGYPEISFEVEDGDGHKDFFLIEVHHSFAANRKVRTRKISE